MIMPTDKSNADGLQALLAELDRELAIAMTARNTAPDADMGGLSTTQAAKLIYTEWGEPGAAVQFNHAIPLVELQQAEFFRGARTFLKALQSAGEVRATASKNLPRQFVAEVLPLLFDEKTLAKINQYSKVVNEQDISLLHYARVVAQAAGLVRIYKGKFGISKAKAALLRDDRAGELYQCLFTAFFRKVNLAYMHPAVFEAHGLQAGAAYTLYRLGLVAKHWKSIADLPTEVLLPAVRAEIETEIRGSEYWTTEKLLTGRLIQWLMDWGLLEGRYEQESKYYKTLKAVRTTPLYAAGLRFQVE